MLDVGDTRVLGLAYQWRDGRVVTLNNLSADPVRVRLPDDLDLTGVEEIRQMFGDSPATAIDTEIDLTGYGYRWLRLIDEEATTSII